MIEKQNERLFKTGLIVSQSGLYHVFEIAFFAQLVLKCPDLTFISSITSLLSQVLIN